VTLVVALAMLAAVAVSASPALADDDDGRTARGNFGFTFIFGPEALVFTARDGSAPAQDTGTATQLNFGITYTAQLEAARPSSNGDRMV
jgi:hypothetical protein